MRSAAARLLVAAVVAAAVVLAVPGPAAACSCALGDPTRMLADAQAAFVGSLAGPPVGTGDFEGDWPFEVEQWVKGDGGAEVDVRSALDGAACGFEVRRGARVGVLLYERDGVLTGGLCSTIDADVLVAAAAPIGPLDGEGPIALLVGGFIGPYRLVALDAEGRDLARAEGETPVYELSVCPGSQFVAELAGNNTVAVRDLMTFETAWEQALPDSDRWYSALDCRAADGSEVLAIGAAQTGAGSDGVVVEASPDGVRTVAEGPWHDGRLAGDAAVVVAGPERSRVLRVDLATGEHTTVFTLDVSEGYGDIGHLLVSPDGRRAAFRAATYHEDTGTSTLHVVDLDTGEIASQPGAGVALWLDADTLVDDTGSGLFVLYAVDDAGISRAGTRVWDFTPRAAAGSTVYGTQGVSGVIRAAPRDLDDTATLRVLPAIAVHAVAAPVGAPVPDPAPQPVPTTTTTTSTLAAATSTTAAPPPVVTTTTAPPLAAPEPDDGGDGPPWLVLAALGGALAGAGAVWAWRRRWLRG